MANEIDLTQINENFPIAGVTQSTQGFRDNFKALKDNFGVAKTKLSAVAVTLGTLDARITSAEEVTLNLEDQIAQSEVILDLQSLIESNYNTLDSRITSTSTTNASAISALAQQVTTLSSSTSSGTQALITQEATTRANADTALSTLITNLTTTVGQNTSAISQEQVTRASADTALSTSITSLEARTYPNPNLVYNPTFIRGLEAWTPYNSTTGAWTVVNGGVWGDYVEFKTSLTGSNYVGYQSDVFKAQAGQNYTIGIDISALGVSSGVVSFQIQWVNASNAVISTTTATNATNGQGWTRYTQTNLAPVGTTQARVRFFIQSTNNTEAMVRRVKVEVGTRMTAFSDETTLGLTITNLTSLITSEAQSRATQDTALATLITNLTTTVTTNNSSQTSAITSEVTSRTNADSALGSRIDTLTTTVNTDRTNLTSLVTQETTARTNALNTIASQISTLNSTVITNYNLLYNPSFSRGLDGWTSYRNDGVDWSPLVSSVNGDVLTYTGNILATKYNGHESTKFKVLANKTYTVSMETNTQGMSAGTFQYQLVWYGASSNLLSSSTLTSVGAGLDWTRSNTQFTSPANAAFASVRFRLGDGSAAVTNTNTAIRRLKVEQGSIVTPFSDDSTLGPVILATQALVSQEATTRANADTSLATLITNLAASTAASDSTIDARVTTEVTARTNADTSLAQSITNLSTTVQNNYNTLNTAITQEATTRTNQDTALGTLITNLTTTVTNNNANLTTLITNETTARTTANSTMGSRVDGIESRVASTEGGLTSVTSRVNTLESVSSTSNEAVALRTTALEAQMRSLGATRPHPTASWDFQSNLSSWTGSGGTLTWTSGGGASLVSSSTDPFIQSPALANDARINGGQFPLVLVEVENTGSVTLNEHILFYSTSGHNYTGSFYATPIGGAPAIAAGARRVLVYDMRSLGAGGQDWTNNLITGLRYDPSNSATSSAKIWRVQVLGFDGGAVEREVRAAITAEQTARTTALDAVATQISSISANLTTNPNLVYNSTFSLALDGWTSYTLNGGTNTAWVVVPSSNVGSYVTSQTTTGGGTTQQGYISQEFVLTASSLYTLSLEMKATSMSGTMSAHIQYLNSSGVETGTSGLVSVSANTDWVKKTVTALAPANTTKARVLLYVVGSTQNPNASFKRIKVELGDQATAWSDETTTGRGLNTLGTNITNEITARTTADTALGSRIDTLTSTVGTNNTTITSRVAAEETTRASETGALGTRATTIEARLNTNANLLKNPSAVDALKNWTSSGTGTWVSEEAVVTGWRFGHSFSNATNKTSSLFSDEVGISPSSQYTLSGQALLAGLTSGTISIHVYFYTSASAYIIDSSRTISNNHNGAFTPLTFVTPSNATKARVYLRLTTATGSAGASFNVWRLKLEAGGVATPYTDDRGDQDLMARMTTADAAIIDIQANKATVTSVTNLTTTVNNNKSAYDSFVTLTSGQTASLASRATALESEVTAARGGGASLTARLGTIEQSVTDVYTGSLATRLNTLEAQLTGSTGSALKSLITDEVTARTTADTTLANRTTALESSINNSGTVGGILARLVTEENTRASADTSLASRATTLESQMAGNTSSFINSRIATEETTRATADTALGNRTTTLESAVNHSTTGLSATFARLVTEETTRANAVSALSTRTTTLESSVTNSATSGGLLARVITEENTRASADTALGSRATTLEAQMAGTQASNLRSRITTLETVTTDGTFATASRATALEATVNATVGGVSNLGARLGVVETATTDGRFATASRAATLEAQMAGSTSSNLSSRISSLETVTSNGTFATASSVTTLTSRLNSGGDVYASIQTANSTAVSAAGVANARSSLALNVNGQITGYQATAGAGVSDFTILASTFKIVDPNNTTTVITPFRVENGNVYMNNAYINNLSVTNLSGGTYNGQMFLSGNKILIDGQNGRILISD